MEPLLLILTILLWMFLSVLAVGFILLIVASIRAILIKEKASVSVDEPNESESQSHGERLATLIEIKTVADKSQEDYSAFDFFHKRLEELFPRVHQNMERTVFPDRTLMFHWKGKADLDPVVLMAHQDVVDADEGSWDVPPFSKTVKDKQIYGRGTFDTKCTLYAFFQAAEELIEEGFIPDRDIFFVSSSNEELSGPGAKQPAEWFKKNGVTPFLVLDEGGAIVRDALPTLTSPIALIGVLEKGYANITFTAKSHGGHSSTPPKHTPIARLANFVHDVEHHFPLETKMIPEVRALLATAAPRMGFLYRLLFGNMWLFKPLITRLLPAMSPYGRALFSTTVAFTMAEGSDAENVIPAEANVVANLRIHPIQDSKASFTVLKRIAEKYDVEAVLTDYRDAKKKVSTDSEAYRFVKHAIKTVFPDVSVSPYMIFGSTDARHYQDVSDAALRFSPIVITNDDLKKMHGDNESLPLASLTKAVWFYKYLMKNMGGNDT